MKMYILVKELVLPGFQAVAIAHASLACYLKYKDLPEMDQWLSGAFYKVICVVDDKTFEYAKTIENHVVITESSLQGHEVAIAFAPREEYPKQFRYMKLLR